MSSSPSRCACADADLDDDGDLEREHRAPVRRPAHLDRGDDDAVVVAQRGHGVDRGLHGRAGSHDEAHLERLRGGARVTRGQACGLSRVGGRHEERAEVAGIRLRPPVEVLAHGDVERCQARREDGCVVDEAVEQRRP